MSSQVEPILVVDDDRQMCLLLTTMLEERGYQCLTATSAKDARASLERRAVALILCDVNMPGESGLVLLREVSASRTETATVMVSGVDEPDIAEFALSLGAYGYLTKPFRRNDLLITVANALRRRELECAERARRELLEEEVALRTKELARALGELRLAQQETITRLARAAEYRDRDTGAHVQRVAHASTVIATTLGLEPARSELIHLAAPLHDIGKISFPDSILASRSPTLSPEEWRLIEGHTTVGWQLLSGSRFELLDVAATIAYTHHERFDGTGYPRRLGGEEIPLEGRIVAVADVFDAVTHYRSYQRTLALDEALGLVRSKRGNHFDPDVLDAFLASVDEIVDKEAAAAALHPSNGPDDSGHIGDAIPSSPLTGQARTPRERGFTSG
jgi:putative two-component system response regulator